MLTLSHGCVTAALRGIGLNLSNRIVHKKFSISPLDKTENRGIMKKKEISTRVTRVLKSCEGGKEL